MTCPIMVFRQAKTLLLVSQPDAQGSRTLRQLIDSLRQSAAGLCACLTRYSFGLATGSPGKHTCYSRHCLLRLDFSLSGKA